MRTFLIYLKMELKRVLRVIPYFLAGATVLTLLLGTVALSAGTLIYGDRAVGKITIGMILPEDGAAAKRVLGMLESLDSVGSVCEFVYVDRESGKKGLADGEFYCLMDVPGTFVQDIMNGTNTPVTIIFPERAGTEAAVLKALTDSAAHTLGVSQAGIYAADELCLANGHPEAVAQVEADLNRIYLRYSASREGYFGKQTVSAAGDVSMTEYYGISAFVMFLLLLGIPAAQFLAPHSRVFTQRLRMMGVGAFQTASARYGAALLLLGGAAALASAAAVCLGAVNFSGYGAAAVALTCLAAAAMILFIYELAGSAPAGVMILFFGTVVMVFLAGGLVPPVFLPASVKAVGQWMPAALMMDALTGAFAAPAPGALAKLGAMAAVFFLLTVGVMKRNE